MPELRVRVPVPTFTKVPPFSSLVSSRSRPLKVVLRLFVPTVITESPVEITPLPSIDPRVAPLK